MTKERMREAGRKSVKATRAFQQGRGSRRTAFLSLAEYNDATADHQLEQPSPPEAIQASVDYLRRLGRRHRAIAEGGITRGR